MKYEMLMMDARREGRAEGLEAGREEVCSEGIRTLVRN